MAFVYRYYGIDAVTVCPSDSETEIDFLIPDNLYIYGGEMFIDGICIGDHLKVEVVDKDAVIPEIARDGGWPILGRYIEKMFIDPVSKRVYINNWPNITQIPAGMYLRVTYSATALGGDRGAVVNVFLAESVA